MTVLLQQYLKTTSFIRDVNNRFNRNKKILKSDGEWLKHRIQEMGPTYIKIGQFMSTRKDVFDKNIVDTLKDLQDKVKPMTSQQVKDVMKANIELKYFKEIEL